MAGKKAMLLGAKSVTDWYQAVSKTPYYSIWNGRQKIFQWREDDKEGGLDMLESTLTQAEENGMDEILSIRLHPALDANGYINEKVYDYDMTFNLMPDRKNVPSGYVSNSHAYRENVQAKTDKLLEKIDLLLQNQQRLNDRITSLEAEEDEEAEDTGLTGVIKGVLQNPTQLQAITGLLGGLFGRNAAMASPGATLAGAPNEDQGKALEALERLRKYDDKIGEDLIRLAVIAETNTPIFNMLIQQLRNG
jgi:hypothetical protein